MCISVQLWHYLRFIDGSWSWPHGCNFQILVMPSMHSHLFLPPNVGHAQIALIIHCASWSKGSMHRAIFPFCMSYLGDFLWLYYSYSHYRLDLLNILHTIVHAFLIGSDAVSTTSIDWWNDYDRSFIIYKSKCSQYRLSDYQWGGNSFREAVDTAFILNFSPAK